MQLSRFFYSKLKEKEDDCLLKNARDLRFGSFSKSLIRRDATRHWQAWQNGRQLLGTFFFSKNVFNKNSPSFWVIKHGSTLVSLFLFHSFNLYPTPFIHKTFFLHYFFTRSLLPPLFYPNPNLRESPLEVLKILVGINAYLLIVLFFSFFLVLFLGDSRYIRDRDPP